MLWERFLAEREKWAITARDAAAHPLAASSLDALGPWCFDEEDRRRLLDLVSSRPGRPSARELLASAGPASDLPEPSGPERDVEELEHRARLARQVRRGIAGTEELVRTWTIDALAAVGRAVDDIGRRAWTEKAYPEDAKDEAARRLWRAFGEGDQLRIWSGWARLYGAEVRRTFHAVMTQARTPHEVKASVGEALREDLPIVQLLATVDGPPGWMDVAVRVLEAAGPGPIASLVELLEDQQRRRLATCAVGHGEWAGTVAERLPAQQAPTRAASLEAELQRPGRAEAWTDLHVARRLLDTWASPEDHATDLQLAWRIVTQNRGRARARLRALCAQLDPGVLVARLTQLRGLHHRTRAAVAAWAYEWAWRQQDRGFAATDAIVVAPRCPPGPSWLEPYDEAAARAVRAWLLLVVLRGQQARLRRWVHTGSTGDHHASWGRLLDMFPVELRDRDPSVARVPEPAPRASTYHRLRHWLAPRLEAELDALRPLLREIASLPDDRRLPSSITARLEPVWHPDVPMPSGRFPAMRAHAHEFQGGRADPPPGPPLPQDSGALASSGSVEFS